MWCQECDLCLANALMMALRTRAVLLKSLRKSLFLFPPEIMKQKTTQKGNRWVNSLNIQQLTQSLEQLKHMAIAKQPSGQNKYWSFSANCRYVKTVNNMS